MSKANVIQEYYEGVEQRMCSEMKTLSTLINHSAEQGRNNESILRQFLENHLPKRFGVATGKVINKSQELSKQADIIIYDRLVMVDFIPSHDWKLVPIEAAVAVIEVKTSLEQGDKLKAALENLASVRKLVSDDSKLIAPRTFVFAFQKSKYFTKRIRDEFEELLSDFIDHERINGLCCLSSGDNNGTSSSDEKYQIYNQGYFHRLPKDAKYKYKKPIPRVICSRKYPLLNFVNALLQGIETRPVKPIKMKDYFNLLLF